jgi:hypothetical protein
VARMGLRWGSVLGIGLAASCAFGTVACSDEDEPDTGHDAASDAPRADTRSDTSVGTDVSTDTSVTDTREAGTPDVSADTGAADGGAPDAAPEGGNCVGGGDAARNGAIGMIAVQMLRCANCHQDEPVDAGLILSGRSTTLVPDATVFPANLTPDPATGLGCWTDDQIIEAFMNGIDDKGQMLCTRMPRFNTRIDAGIAQEIVNFLRTIPAVNKAIPETVICPPVPPPVDGGTDAGDAGVPPDGPTPDGGAPDGTAPDGTTPDAGPDATAPEAGPDGTPPDGTAPDAGTDVVLPDVGTNDGVSTDVDIDGGG